MTRYFEDFSVGQIYKHWPGRTITEFDNTWFTLMTMNTNPIHFDAAYAATTQHGRPLVREGTIEQYKKNPKFVEEMAELPELHSIYPEISYDKGYQWGMAIDLGACTGCNACVVACVAELHRARC